jgi:ribonucleoside-diphosphate reductase alpha chain
MAADPGGDPSAPADAPAASDPVRDQPPPDNARRRRKLPVTRPGTTHKFRIGDAKGYITANNYADGTLGEIFLKMDQQGSQVSGFCDAWAIAVSIMLQMGVPLDYIVKMYKGTRFPPEGMTGYPGIEIAKSPIDYVVRWLEKMYLPA